MSEAFRIAGVMGHPVGHSLSPVLHNGWLTDLGLQGVYLPLDVQPEALGAAVAGLKALGFAGANVTIPHKEAVMAHLDEIDDTARAIGAVNTLVVSGDRILGRNTDVEGFLAHLEASAPAWKSTLEGRSALILGAGGAARGIVYGLKTAGVARLIVANRSRDRAEALAAGLGNGIEVIDWPARIGAVEGAGLIVNTTSLGMRGQPPLELDLAGASPGTIVCDIVYNPLHTNLLRSAAQRGLKTVGGLGMLVHQARAGFAAWFGVVPPVNDQVYRRLVDALPGSAKS
jgi:shikimate dehydrogenase